MTFIVLGLDLQSLPTLVNEVDQSGGVFCRQAKRNFQIIDLILGQLSADDRNTFSFVCVSCGAIAYNRVLIAQAFVQGVYLYKLICSCIYDVFDQKTINMSSVCHMFMFIILQFENNFVFWIDYLYSPSKLYCYTDFLMFNIETNRFFFKCQLVIQYSKRPFN